MSADAYDRVWFNRQRLADDGDEYTMHESEACAARETAAVPSFAAIGRAVEADRCGSCCDHHLSADNPDWTADAVRAVRAARDWTQADLADQLGVAPSTVANWESGHAQPGADAVAALDALAPADDADDTEDTTDSGPSEAVVRDVADAVESISALARMFDGLATYEARQLNDDLGLGLDDERGYGAQNVSRGAAPSQDT